MNKQVIQNKIEKLQQQFIQQIEKLKEEINSIVDEKSKKGVSQKPKIGGKYWYLTDYGDIRCLSWQGDPIDLFRFTTGNCFKTFEEAQDYKENLLTKQQLKDLALELNEGVEIDWGNYAQSKFSIYYNDARFGQELKLDSADCYMEIGQIYCLNNDFLTIAKERIGEEKLIKLIKSGV